MNQYKVHLNLAKFYGFEPLTRAQFVKKWNKMMPWDKV